jgi:hypothetical protein
MQGNAYYNIMNERALYTFKKQKEEYVIWDLQKFAMIILRLLNKIFNGVNHHYTCIISPSLGRQSFILLFSFVFVG